MKVFIGPALKYFALFLLIYGILTGISMVPAVGEFCNRIYRKPTEPILAAMLQKAYIQIKADGDYYEILRIEFASKAQVQEQMATAKRTGNAMVTITGTQNEVNFQNLFTGFFLFLVTLVLLSPVGWKQKVKSLVIGTILYYLFTVFKLYLVELIFFNEPQIAIYQTNSILLSIVKGIRYCMTLSINVLVILVIWAALVLKKDNWKALVGRGGMTNF
ncbi:MAG: hypothetical protein H6574_15030 [Lewinellaceae bacterium]|nr:hypothetical protein [Saprospiraceae bacterium]MCB9332393.1 hypothetical protein [Lewinellaceae bacterium]